MHLGAENSILYSAVETSLRVQNMRYENTLYFGRLTFGIEISKYFYLNSVIFSASLTAANDRMNPKYCLKAQSVVDWHMRLTMKPFFQQNS